MRKPLEPGDLWRTVDPGSLGLKNTRNLDPLKGIIGQERAVQALRFGLEIDKFGPAKKQAPRRSGAAILLTA